MEERVATIDTTGHSEETLSVRAGGDRLTATLLLLCVHTSLWCSHLYPYIALRYLSLNCSDHSQDQSSTSFWPHCTKIGTVWSAAIFQTPDCYMYNY